MVKDEQDSIGMTIRSTKDMVHHVIVYDTGSSDNTLPIITRTCQQNGQELHLSMGTFTTFPESRNEALRFASTIPVDFLLLMDAGDELRAGSNKDAIHGFLEKCGKDYFLINQHWVDNLELSQHTDIRLIRNRRNLYYDLSHPVHERLANIYSPPTLFPHFILFQDRDLYGKKSSERHHRDIQLLKKAEPNRRNLYFLGQSYMSIDDYENGFHYYQLYLDHPNKQDYVDEQSACSRAGYCAIMCKKEKSVIMRHLDMAVRFPQPSIDAYIYLLKYCIENNDPSTALPYLEEIVRLEKPKTGVLISHQFYDYTRWHLISIICLISGKKWELGWAAIQKIIHLNKPNDAHNYKIYQAGTAAKS